MARNVFADTSGLYALLNRNDAIHPYARVQLDQLIRAGKRLITTDYVVTETVNLANARGGRLVAARVLDLVEQSTGLRLEWIGPARFEEVKRFFRKHADHSFSFTDCSSFVVMRELKLTEALTSDRHFIAAGFKALLTQSI